MRSVLIATVAMLAGFAAFGGTAQAGFVYQWGADGIGNVAFDSRPLERPDVRVTVSDGGAAVTFEDLRNPITPGLPPAADTRPNARPCEIVSAHVARCTPPFAVSPYHEVYLGLASGGPARVRDLPGSGHLHYWVNTGPLGDVIALDHGRTYDVEDEGGPNEISVASQHGADVRLGPGRSAVDVQNGVFDSVKCLKAAPALGIGALNFLDAITADPGDSVVDCDRRVWKNRRATLRDTLRPA